MSDTPNGKIVGIHEHVPKSRRDRMQRPPTTEEVSEWIKAGSIAAMKNVYTQMAEENVRLFEQMEQIAVERVLVEIERRSLRGRLRALSLRAWETFADGHSRGWDRCAALWRRMRS